MKVQIIYTEEWRRVVEHEIDDAEFAEWFGPGEPTGSDVREFLNAGDDQFQWASQEYPGTRDTSGDEFDHLEIDEVILP